MDKMNKLMNMSGVYIITCTGNDKFYIGSTEKLEIRYEQHMKDCRYASFKVKEMNVDALKYGIDSFKFDALCTCNYRVLTIVENHYIKLYNAKENGYNKRFAPNKLISKNKYRYTPISQLAIEDSKVNNLLDLFITHISKFETHNNSIIVSLTQLIEIFETETGLYEEYINNFLGLISKLDSNCYFKHPNENIIYKISGKQLGSLFNGGSFFKSNIPLDKDFRRYLSKGITTNNIFIEIDELKNNYSSINFIANEEYINKYDIKDLRHNPYNITNY